MRARIGHIMTESRRNDYEEALASARLALSDDTFAAAWEKGHAMTTEQAVDYALSSEEELGHD